MARQPPVRGEQERSRGTSHRAAAARGPTCLPSMASRSLKKRVPNGTAQAGLIGYLLLSHRPEFHSFGNVARVMRSTMQTFPAVGLRSPSNTTEGRSVTFAIHSFPSGVLSRMPTAQSSYEATTNPSFAANDRKKSMWQLDNAATSASSGSTPEGSENGSGTVNGDADARTLALPSKSHSCARL